MQNPPVPRPRRVRPSLNAARADLDRALIDEWAWRRVYETLKAIANLTARGIVIPDGLP